ncbi:MAG: hypothetical protein U9R37_01360 [Campylobacterota bacterium]|nr:hypothetical protein [Campylobacterota bacterium]
MLSKKIVLSLLFIYMVTLNLSASDKYTMEQIYNKMCIECHSSNGSGNTDKLTPSMIGQTQQEIKISLIDIEKDNGHIIMEHNRGKILEMGMKYSASDMSKYMYERFNK